MFGDFTPSHSEKLCVCCTLYVLHGHLHELWNASATPHTIARAGEEPLMNLAVSSTVCVELDISDVKRKGDELTEDELTERNETEKSASFSDAEEKNVERNRYLNLECKCVSICVTSCSGFFFILFLNQIYYVWRLKTAKNFAKVTVV